MTDWAIGDVQGCWEPLRRLLDRIDFDPARDRVWLAGDLVNRGHGSLHVLRWVRDLGDRAVAVLGNHDIHLLACALGVRDLRRRDTLEHVLEAPDCDDLLDWLRRRPLLHREGDHVMVHAGVHPRWDLDEAAALAAEAETILRGPDAAEYLAASYARPQTRWKDSHRGHRRFSALLTVFTRVRCMEPDGTMTDYSGPLDRIPAGQVPWWRFPGRRPLGATVVFGHWAAVGLHREPGILALDSGCVWGRSLTAVRLDDGHVEQVACPGA
ncbi:MAG: symmetrical bis(5'-nucleosyl)-tetraphosphatase [Myxococcota bacterium]